MKSQIQPKGPLPEAPSHLVISLEDGPPIADAVQRVTGKLSTAKRAEGVRGPLPEGVELLSARHTGGAQGTLFREFKIAAVDLEPAEASQIRQENVLVVPNEIRRILGAPSASRGQRFWGTSPSGHRPLPPPGAGGGHRPLPPPGAGGGHRPLPFATIVDKTPSDVETPDDCWDHRCLPFGPQLLDVGGGAIASQGSLLAFVEGQKVALDSVLARLGAEGATASAESAVGAWIESTTDLEWHLRVLGVRSSDYRWTGRGIQVAVLDTGIDLEHPDFAGRLVPANCRSFVPGAATVMDGNGHGTHCCGLVNGPTRPGVGARYGAAPDTELLVGKVMSDAGEGYDSWIISGIAWAAARGARVISLSLGSERTHNGAYAMAYEQIALKLARRAQDCLLIAAAGNDSRRSAGYIAPVGNPAACPSYMAVAAIDAGGRVADFSCGELDRTGTLELSAPGVSVRSSIPTAMADSDEPYAAFDGTSMSAPLAAGAAALWLQARPGLRSLELWRELIRNTRRLGRRRDYGFGLVQVP